MRSLKSMLMTLVCAGIILALGYFGIVESGSQILKSEGIPEKAKYENAGSNIFYGKIEDDIEIFPWNYYTKSGKELEKGTPLFLEETLISDKESAEFDQTDAMEFSADWYFGEMIAYEAQVDAEEVYRWFESSEKHIYRNMRMKEGTSYGNIYFYQENMRLGGTEYQVRIACSDWNVISFICAEYDTGDQREQEEWKKGKETIITALEESENVLEDYLDYMRQMEFLAVPAFYYYDNNYVNAYLQSLQLLDYLLLGKGDAQLRAQTEGLLEALGQEKLASAKTEGTDGEIHYSCQVVELKDMILLLIQGDMTIGIYYDPINQAFCGYNYFYKY